MNFTAIHTSRLLRADDLFEFICDQIETIPQQSVLCIVSKLFSISQNRYIPKDPNISTKIQKHSLVRQEADSYLEPHSSKYDLMLTIKNNWMFVNAGIDESNANNGFLLWPKHPQQSISTLWKQLKKHYQLKEFGMIMTDSKSMPLNWGVMGHGLAYAGFKPLYSYIGKPDLDGRVMQMEQLNLVQCIAASATLSMGEGAESTPLCLVRDIPKIQFQDRPPTQDELNNLKIAIEDDAYAPLLTAVDWKKNDRRNT